MNQLQMFLLMEVIRESKLNTSPCASNDVEFDIPSVQVPISSSDEEYYYTNDSQEIQSEPDQFTSYSSGELFL